MAPLPAAPKTRHSRSLMLNLSQTIRLVEGIHGAMPELRSVVTRQSHGTYATLEMRYRVDRVLRLDPCSGVCQIIDLTAAAISHSCEWTDEYTFASVLQRKIARNVRILSLSHPGPGFDFNDAVPSEDTEVDGLYLGDMKIIPDESTALSSFSLQMRSNAQSRCFKLEVPLSFIDIGSGSWHYGTSE
ncbi:hypothetical protein CIHG_06240 [Coccidioides immitis H538.4]|uniref:Uncharacterized protein n=3 Tax=Coccidioides immitis TaxID=5501 RepID=A0A0J8QRF8_COCIT|nr:hypothetical protein CIRG_09516 [Coccidioides immitis RMSCC 2394]KMU75284.1 hypothetical protein CISG_04703 [Coccidioides immitis RMSCC 3703]KMU88440.1 hypothetical protein CIHG_06240 [Coccidioides immitis H538.4]